MVLVSDRDAEGTTPDGVALEGTDDAVSDFIVAVSSFTPNPNS